MRFRSGTATRHGLQRMDLLIQWVIDGLRSGVIAGLLGLSCSLVCGVRRGLVFTIAGFYFAAIAVTLVISAAAAAAGITTETVVLALALLATISLSGLICLAIRAAAIRLGGAGIASLPMTASAGALLLAAGTLQAAGQLRIPEWLVRHQAIQIPAVEALLILPGLVAGAAVLWFLQRSVFGRARRAVVQDRRMAELLGLDGASIDLKAFAIAAAAASLAGWMSCIDTAAVPVAGVIGPVACVVTAVIAFGLYSPKRATATGFAIGCAAQLWNGWFGGEYGAYAALAVLLFVVVFTQEQVAGRAGEAL